MKRLLKGFTYK